MLIHQRHPVRAGAIPAAERREEAGALQRFQARILVQVQGRALIARSPAVVAFIYRHFGPFHLRQYGESQATGTSPDDGYPIVLY